MRQAQKTNTESNQTSLQRKSEKNPENSKKLSEFTDNRSHIVAQKKLSETIGQKEAKILPFAPNTAPLTHNDASTQLKSHNNTTHPITQFKEPSNL